MWKPCSLFLCAHTHGTKVRPTVIVKVFALGNVMALFVHMSYWRLSLHHLDKF